MRSTLGISLPAAARSRKQATGVRAFSSTPALVPARIPDALLHPTPVVTFSAIYSDPPAITFVHPAVRQRLGYTQREITTDPAFWMSHIHPGDAEKVQAALRSLPRKRHIALEYRLRHRTGAYRSLCNEITLVPSRTAQPPKLLGFWLDVTDRRRVEAALLATLECGEAMMRATTEQQLLDSICATIARMGSYRMAWVAFLDEDRSNKALRPVAKAGLGVDYLDAIHVTWADEPHGRGPMGLAARTRRRVVCRDIQRDPRFAPWRHEALRRGYAAALALPLVWRRQCLGVVGIYSDEEGAFPEQEISVLQRLSGDITYGLTAMRARAQEERLQRELLEASEREQLRIAQDLHDGLCQHLVGVSFLARTLHKRLSTEHHREAAAAAEIAALTQQAATDARAQSHGIHPVDGTPAALRHALAEFAQTTARIFSVECRFICPARVKVHHHPTAIHLYRIAQEAINNAIKHGKSTRLTIRLQKGLNQHLELAVRDNGIGLPDAPAPGGGMGLRIMRYRASMCGGTLHIGPGPRRGTLVSCRVPSRPLPAGPVPP